MPGRSPPREAHTTPSASRAATTFLGSSSPGRKVHTATRRRGSVDVHRWTPSRARRPSMSALRELAAPGLDRILSDVQEEAKLVPERPDGGLVTLPEAFMRARQPTLPGIRAEDRSVEAVLNGGVHVQDAHLLRSAGPLVPASRIEVGLHLGEVYVEQAERLRPVHEGEDTAPSREGTDLGGGKEVAIRVREVCEPEHARARRERAIEGVQVVVRTRVRGDDRHLPHRVAPSLRLLLPRAIVARMVVGEEEHFIAKAQVEPARHEVVPLAGVAGDEDVFRSDPEVLCQQIAGGLLHPVHLPRGRRGPGRGRAESCGRSWPGGPAAVTGKDWPRSTPRAPWA